MNEQTARRHLADLKQRLTDGQPEDWLQVRNHAALLFERMFGDLAHPLVRLALELEVPQVTERAGRSLLGRVLTRSVPDWKEFRRQVLGLLENAEYRLDLDRSLPVLSARRPSDDALTHLRKQFAALLVEVESSELGAEDRSDLRAVIEEALRILDHADDPEGVRNDLERLIGRSVGRASRGGPGHTFWNRVATAVILADAAFGVGANMQQLTTSPDPVVLEVECRVGMLALPPAPESAPSDIPEGTARPEGSPLDGPEAETVETSTQPPRKLAE